MTTAGAVVVCRTTTQKNKNERNNNEHIYLSTTLKVIPALFNLSIRGIPMAVAVVKKPPFFDSRSSRAKQRPHSASICTVTFADMV